MGSGFGVPKGAAVVYKPGSRKRVLLDKEPARASDLLERIKVVSFAPSDVRLVQDSAQIRRRFLARRGLSGRGLGRFRLR